MYSFFLLLFNPLIWVPDRFLGRPCSPRFLNICKGLVKFLAPKTETLHLIAGLTHDFDSYHTWFHVAASQKSPVETCFLKQ